MAKLERREERSTASVRKPRRPATVLRRAVPAKTSMTSGASSCGNNFWHVVDEGIEVDKLGVQDDNDEHLVEASGFAGR